MILFTVQHFCCCGWLVAGLLVCLFFQIKFSQLSELPTYVHTFIYCCFFRVVEVFFSVVFKFEICVRIELCDRIFAVDMVRKKNKFKMRDKIKIEVFHGDA